MLPHTGGISPNEDYLLMCGSLQVRTVIEKCAEKCALSLNYCNLIIITKNFTLLVYLSLSDVEHEFNVCIFFVIIFIKQ